MSAEEIRDNIEEAADTAGETIADIAEEKAEDVKEAVEEKADDIKEAVEEKAEDVKEAVEEKAEDVKKAVEEKADDIKEAVEEKIGTVKKSAKEKAEEAKKALQEKAEEEDDGKSHSQKKREQRKKEVASARRKARTSTIVGWVIGAAVLALVVWGVCVLVGRQLNKVAPIDNYSQGLDENGYITGVTASDKVTLPDYKNIKIPYDEIAYSDEDLQSEIDSNLAQYVEISSDPDKTVADGDKVNIAYVGTVDGVEFEGGTSDSYDLTIGSGSFIDDFEQQLIGAAVGDTVVVDATFPEDYRTEDLSGKDAEFTVDILGIYDSPELTDDFVAETLSADIEDAQVSTVQEYKDYLRGKHEADNIKDYVRNYLIENSEVKSYPGKYVRTLKGIKRYDDEQSFEYMNQMYQQYYGYSVYNSFEDYIGMSMTEYFDDLSDQAKDTCKENLVFQAIVEKEGATADAAYYKGVLTAQGDDESYYDSMVENSGEPFVLQQAIAEKAVEIASGSATVDK